MVKNNPICDDTKKLIKEDNAEKVRKNKEDLIDLASNSKAFEKLRMDAGNREVFGIFVNFCLVHLKSSVNWWYKTYTTYVLDMFTDTDKALAMLLVKTNIEAFK